MRFKITRIIRTIIIHYNMKEIKNVPHCISLFSVIFFALFFNHRLVKAANAGNKNDSIIITAQVTNAFTHEGIDSALVEIAQKNGIFHTTTVTFDRNGKERKLWLKIEGYIPSDAPPSEILFKAHVPTTGTYIITVSAKGYESKKVEMTIPAKHYNRRPKEWEGKEIRLGRNLSPVCCPKLKSRAP
jgi:hypothetical protein